MALQYANHASNPAAQPFNGKGIRNKTKTNAWWQKGTDNNGKGRKKEKVGD